MDFVLFLSLNLQHSHMYVSNSLLQPCTIQVNSTAAKINEVFEAKYTASAFGVMSIISELLVNTSIIILGNAVLDGDMSDYLILFSIAASGPAIAFVVTMFFKPTKEDLAKRKRLCCQ